jgi:hypothetical protein
LRSKASLCSLRFLLLKKIVSASRRCTGREATARLSNQPAAAGAPQTSVLSVNGADGISDTEGKAAMVAASELGNEQVSNPWRNYFCFSSQSF